MLTTTKIIRTHRLTPEELEEAIMLYMERDEEVSKDLRNGEYSLNYLTKPVAFDQMSGRITSVGICGVELIVQKEM